MPVIIRNINTTKLCIIKGPEGHVVGWQAGKGPHGKNILDTIFTKPDQPAKTVILMDFLKMWFLSPEAQKM
jgi:hypothetical protein